MARRAKALGLKVLVDLHYSDFWADPASSGRRPPGTVSRTTR